MVKKRLVGVITVRDGRAVQSFGYRRYLPLGAPARLAENLDRWGADEIAVLCIDRSRPPRGPDFDVLRDIGALGMSTPLVYGGGVRHADDAARCVAAGADRIVIDALLHDDPGAVAQIADVVGAQAVIASVPVRRPGTAVEWLDYRTDAAAPDSAWQVRLAPLVAQRHVSEMLLIDVLHDGDLGDGFDRALLDTVPVGDIPIIAFGGVGRPDLTAAVFAHPRVSAVAIGNRLAYREHALQAVRATLAAADIRPPRFSESDAGW